MADNKDQSAIGPLVVVFAGPNGSGKTSLIDELKQTGLATMRGVVPLPAYFINPDQVAKDLEGEFVDQNSRDEAAQRAAMQARAEAIAGRVPFAFETVMSHSSRINEMLMLKEQGYHLFLTFITTDDPEKNVERVKFRYETGSTTGHYVKPEKVRERYHRTLALLPRAAEIADAVYVYDNSVDGKSATLQVVIERDGQFSIADGAKDWAIEQLIKPLQAREEELDYLLVALDKVGYTCGDTDELRGTYTGKVLTTTPHFVAQYDSTSQQAVIHDRLMLETSSRLTGEAQIKYADGELLTIRYSFNGAPQLERLAITPTAR
jgi:predicted ABC-type ATPase